MQQQNITCRLRRLTLCGATGVELPTGRLRPCFCEELSDVETLSDSAVDELLVDLEDAAAAIGSYPLPASLPAPLSW